MGSLDFLHRQPQSAWQAVRGRLRDLALRAGAGDHPDALAAHLAGTWRLAVCPPGRTTAERSALAAEVAVGTCAAARWLDPGRSAQAVPPLAVAVWHVGALARQDPPAMLWLDIVLPGDGRRAAALDWAADVRLLLARAAIPHHTETALVPAAAAAAAGSDAAAAAAVEVQAPAAVRVWGCMSLVHQYLRSGERGSEHPQRRDGGRRWA